MNLNSQIKSIDSIIFHFPRGTPEPQILQSQNFHHFETHSHEHSRKTSQGSAKSLPLTCSSMSIQSDTKRLKSSIKLRDTPRELRTKATYYQQTQEHGGNGEDPYELVTQPEIPKLV